MRSLLAAVKRLAIWTSSAGAASSASAVWTAAAWADSDLGQGRLAGLRLLRGRGRLGFLGGDGFFVRPSGFWNSGRNQRSGRDVLLRLAAGSKPPASSRICSSLAKSTGQSFLRPRGPCDRVRGRVDAQTRLTSYSNLEPTAGRQIANALIGLSAQLTPGTVPQPAPLPAFQGQPWSYGRVPPELD